MITCAFENGNQASLRHAIVDTLVLKQDKILLVKRTGKLLEGGKWGLVGGFTERDETMAQTAARETLEETGWQIADLTLLTIIDSPDRPKEDRQNIAFVFFGQATKQVAEPDDESDDQRWFPLSDLPPDKSIAFDHAKDIKLYKKYLKEKFTLPALGN